MPVALSMLTVEVGKQRQAEASKGKQRQAERRERNELRARRAGCGTLVSRAGDAPATQLLTQAGAACGA